MLGLESKSRILENFYAVDYVLFGKPIKEMNFTCVDMVKEYIGLKAALLSTMIEMLGIVDHKPEVIKEQLDTNSLVKIANVSARIARENCQKLVTSDKSREIIKIELREAISKNPEMKEKEINEAIQEKIREKAFRLAVDNLLIARTISESENFKGLDSWEGKIIEDAYKSLRNNLVEISMNLMYNCESSTDETNCGCCSEENIGDIFSESIKKLEDYVMKK